MKKIIFTIGLIMLIVFTTVFTTSVSSASQTLHISYNQIMSGQIGRHFKVEKVGHVAPDYLPKYEGKAYDGSRIQIIGNKEDVSQTAIIVFLPPPSYGSDVRQNGYKLLMFFLVNVFPKWNSSMIWLETAVYVAENLGRADKYVFNNISVKLTPIGNNFYCLGIKPADVK